MFRRDFLKSSAIALASTPLLAQDKPFALVKKVKPFTTSSKELDDCLKSDKKQIIIRVVKWPSTKNLVEFLQKNNDPSTYTVVQDYSIDYNNLPQSKYIFVISAYTKYHRMLKSCPGYDHNTWTSTFSGMYVNNIDFTIYPHGSYLNIVGNTLKDGGGQRTIKIEGLHFE